MNVITADGGSLWVYWPEQCSVCKGCPRNDEYKERTQKYISDLRNLELNSRGIYGTTEYKCDYFNIDEEKYRKHNNTDGCVPSKPEPEPFMLKYVLEGDTASHKGIKAEEIVVNQLKFKAEEQKGFGCEWYIYRRTMDLLFESRGMSPNIEFILTNRVLETTEHPLGGKYELCLKFEVDNQDMYQDA